MYGRALSAGGELHLVRADGSSHAVDVRRYLRAVDDVDLEVVRRCTGATLDIGCGPARFVSALMARGVPALGIDVAAEAVAVARSAGANVLRRSVFRPLPHEGAWQHVLLLDENIGIGGSPHALLGRVRDLLAPTGRALVELDPDDTAYERVALRMRDGGGRTSRSFRWARLGLHALASVAGEVGLRPVERWSSGGRRFVVLAPRQPDGA